MALVVRDTAGEKTAGFELHVERTFTDARRLASERRSGCCVCPDLLRRSGDACVTNILRCRSASQCQWCGQHITTHDLGFYRASGVADQIDRRPCVHTRV